MACCHWNVCNSCLIKTVQRCSLCGVLLLERVYSEVEVIIRLSAVLQTKKMRRGRCYYEVMVRLWWGHVKVTCCFTDYSLVGRRRVVLQTIGRSCRGHVEIICCFTDCSMVMSWWGHVEVTCCFTYRSMMRLFWGHVEITCCFTDYSEVMLRSCWGYLLLYRL